MFVCVSWATSLSELVEHVSRMWVKSHLRQLIFFALGVVLCCSVFLNCLSLVVSLRSDFNKGKSFLTVPFFLKSFSVHLHVHTVHGILSCRNATCRQQLARLTAECATKVSDSN